MPGFNEVIERLRRSTVQIADGRATGTGIVWNASGSILTNAHVARGNEIGIIDHRGRSLHGRVTRRDPERDLAMLETGVTDLEPAKIGDSAAIRPGEIAIAIGNPLGVAGAAAWGIIHTVGPLDFGGRGTWIQADLRLAPGNSGGPLATASGDVIGMNTMIYHGLALAAPVAEASAFAGDQPNGLRLGLEILRTPEGLIVLHVEPDSLAARAGVLAGDVLHCSIAGLRRVLGGIGTFGSAEIAISRGGRPRTLRVQTDVRAGVHAA